MLDRRSFVKMVGVGCVAGPSVMAAGVTAKPGITSPAMRGIDMSSTLSSLNVEVWCETAGGRIIPVINRGSNMTAIEVREIMIAGYGPGYGPIRYKDYIIHWGPSKVQLKEI